MFTRQFGHMRTKVLNVTAIGLNNGAEPVPGVSPMSSSVPKDVLPPLDPLEDVLA